MIKLAIIGGGAAGLMAACAASGARISVFEKNEKPGMKLGITGKGRCNLTNARTPREMLEFIPRGANFLQSALYSFSATDTMSFFESLGVKLKQERGERVFPVSDRAGEIVSALTKAAFSSENVRLCHEKVLGVRKTPCGFALRLPSGEEEFDRVILATGGASYPKTGSDGAGFSFARALGHTVSPILPALIPLETDEKDAAEMMGLSLKNAAIRVLNESGKEIYHDFGEMLFTHFGVSGPVILSASSYFDFSGGKRFRLLIDLKPALDAASLDARLLREFSASVNRDFVHTAASLLPQKMILPLLARAGIDPRKKTNSVTREERQRLVSLLKALPFTLVRPRPIAEAIVTRGGVKLSEINPKTMESRLVPGLYFAGEILDADALTGGFNLQIAFSTGHAAGLAASEG